MTNFSISILIINVLLILALPRRWAPMPLLIGACYVTRWQSIEIGPATFTVVRLLIAAGFIRMVIRGERLSGKLHGLDKLMIAWGAWAIISSLLHQNLSSALIFRLGMVYDTFGIYFLIRSFCQSMDDFVALFRILAILLVPVALNMIYEKIAMINIFNLLTGGTGEVGIRNNKIRAMGPFAHAILSGTVGAVCLPMMIGLLRKNRKTAIIGIVACISIVFASASSGPILSLFAGAAALIFWRWRHLTSTARWTAVFGYIALDIVMKDPAYYLIARIDLVGGSTGWHRSHLIERALMHLPEWWLGGTDYTRHWMPTGVSWSPNHTDITNHYLQMGVVGGLPLMILFIAIMFKSFSLLGKILEQNSDMSLNEKFFIWTIGASLFAHAVTSIAVSYFDQSVVFLNFTFAAIGTGYAVNFTNNAQT